MVVGGGGSGGGGVGTGTIYLTLHCYHPNDFSMKKGSAENHTVLMLHSL